MTNSELMPHFTYREGLANGKLLYQLCGGCSEAVFYPRIVCPFCGSDDLTVFESTGNATVYSTTVITGRSGSTYCVCLIDLDEGFRMMSSVVNIPAENVFIGMRVRLAFDTDKEGEPRAVFEAL